MASESTSELTYREQSVDEALNEHDTRITKNERRWLLTKGAMAMLAAIKGVDVVASELTALL